MKHFPGTNEGCNIRTYIDLGLSDYVTNRFHSQQKPRFAVVPFEVPETFAPPGNVSQNFGRDMANLFQQQLLQRGELGIIENFDRDRWPGKRAEFFTGNYGAIELARNAGYDFVIVGFMKDIVNESELTLLTRVIDTANSITVWYGETTAFTTEREARRTISRLSRGWVKDRPELFDFPGRTDLLISCTTQRLIRGKSFEEEHLLQEPMDNPEAKKKIPL